MKMPEEMQREIIYPLLHTLLIKNNVNDYEVDSFLQLLTDPEVMDFKEQTEMILYNEVLQEKIKETRDILQEGYQG